jgi:hypothetical protein
MNTIEKIVKGSFILRLESFDRLIQRLLKRKRIDYIENFLPKQGIGAELGVFKGHLSPILLKHTNATKLHLIDPWYFLTPYWSWANGNKSTVDSLIKILTLFKQEINRGRVVVHVGDDRQVLESFPDQYIDSSHEYNHTLQELNILDRKIKNQGVIGGDDWQPNPDHRHHGVYKAVNEFVTAQKYEIIYSNEENRQWAIKKS